MDLADLLEQLGDAVTAMDTSGVVTFFNAAAEELYGHRAVEVLGRHYLMLVPQGVAGNAAAQFDRALHGEIRRVDGHILRRDGATPWATLTLAPVRDVAGEIVGASMIARDTAERQLRERQHELVAQLAAETETVAVIGTNREGLVTVFNRGAEELLGYTAEEAIGRLDGRLLLDKDELARRTEAGNGNAFPRALQGEVEEGVWTYRRKDGSALEVLLTVRAVLNLLGEVQGFVSFARDISALRDAELARLQAEERFRIAFEHAPIGLALTSLEGPDTGHWKQTNPALARMLGYEPGELDGRAITDVTHPDDRGRTPALIEQLRGQRGIVVEKRFIRKDGTSVWTYLSSTPVPNPLGQRASYSVTQVLDISERRRFEQQLHYLADHDPLTGLFNRRRFEAELERTIEDSRLLLGRASLLVLDLDGFKKVNDRFGHAVGDDLVRHIGGLLRHHVRSTDFVARLGGDEFAVILRDCDSDQAIMLAEKLLDVIREGGMIVTGEGTARVTTSVGIATYGPGSLESADELAVGADSAMYQAKAEGRNRYAVHIPEGASRLELVERDSWFARLRRALDEDRFVLHAQPVVPICGVGLPRFELLIRMLDDRGEVVPPGAFLSEAERFDLIGEIDRWVLRRAISLLHEQTRAGNDISVSVNLSGKTMSDLDLAGDLSEMLRQTPIPSGRLVVEVTETAAIVGIERARELAKQLRRMGCLFALDDFGSGFSSFYYLKHLDFDYLKIDGEFITNLVRSPTDRLLVQAVVDIARGLGTQTIAEFVDDADTLELLRTLGVDYGQGYHLGRPAPIERVLPEIPGSPDHGH